MKLITTAAAAAAAAAAAPLSVAYLGFCEGGRQSQKREVRGGGGANGVECGEGVSPPH